jgi:hypothetical protein
MIIVTRPASLAYKPRVFACHQAPFRVIRMLSGRTTIEFENASCRQAVVFVESWPFIGRCALTLFYHPATAGAGLTFTL